MFFSFFFHLFHIIKCQTHKWGREAAVCFFFLLFYFGGLWVNLCLLKFSLTDSWFFLFLLMLLLFLSLFNECYAFFFCIICFAFWLLLKWKFYRLELEVQLISFSKSFLNLLGLLLFVGENKNARNNPLVLSFTISLNQVIFNYVYDL